jgi:hypothetical protein
VLAGADEEGSEGVGSFVQLGEDGSDLHEVGAGAGDYGDFHVLFCDEGGGGGLWVEGIAVYDRDQ